MKWSSLICCSSPTPPAADPIPLQPRAAPVMGLPPSVPERPVSPRSIIGERATAARLRQALPQAAEKPAGPAQLAELESFARRVLDAFQRSAEARSLNEWLRENPDVRRGIEEAPDEIGRIFQACQDIAYRIYAENSLPHPLVWNQAGKEAFLRGLQQIEKNPDVFFTSQQPKGYTPSELLNQDAAQAFKCAFYVHPGSDKNMRRPYRDPVTGVQSRLSLSTKPDHVLEVARMLAGEFGGEFDDMISRYKIMAAEEHGGSPDNIVIYLTRVDPGQAKRLAQHVFLAVSPDAWESHAPVGMHRFCRGIAYAESMRDASGSYGESRAALAARAVLRHLVDKVELDAAFREALTENGYSLKNPAFVEREGLEDLLARL